MVPNQVSTYVGAYILTNSNSLPADSALAVLINGVGKITSAGGATNMARLKLGKSYAITASELPGRNWIFANWSSGTNIADLALYSTKPATSFTFSSNLILVANFQTNPFPSMAGVYNGLFATTNGVTEQTAGMLHGLTVSGSGTYSGTLLINGKGHSFSGAFDLGGQASNVISRAINQPLTVAMTLLNLNQSSPEIIGTVSGTSNGVAWVAALLADRAYHSKSSAAYTMLIPPGSSSASATVPIGDGYALITNHAGTATIAGALADGAKIIQSVAVSQTGNVPIYANLSGQPGLLMGWINLDSASDAGAGLAWVHPSVPKGLFPDAFTSTNPIALSLWTKTQAIDVLEHLTNLSILEPTHGATIETNSFEIAIGNNFKLGKLSGPAKLSGSLASKTGLLRVTNVSGSVKVTGQGVVLLNTTNGGGYILTKANAQAIQLGP